MNRRPEPFIRSLDHFRGLSILFIVAGHCFSLAGLQIDTFSERVFSNLVHGGTTLFVFISGYLFHHRFLRDYRYGAFLASKFRNIVLPYLILSVLPIGWAILHHDPMYDGYFLPRGPGIFEQFVRPAVLYLYSGRALIAYWFIPFTTIQFMMAPLHRSFARTGPLGQFLSISATLLLALYIQRPLDNIDPLQSVLYFLPVYLIGIACSQRRVAIMDLLRGRELWLLVPILGLAAWEAVQRLDFGNYHKNAFDAGLFDLILPQKILMCIFFLVFLDRFEFKTSRMIGFLAKSSFAIFFLHPYVLWICELYRFRYEGHPIWPFYAPIVVAVLGASIAIALLAKRIFGRRSRFLIGW